MLAYARFMTRSQSVHFDPGAAADADPAFDRGRFAYRGRWDRSLRPNVYRVRVAINLFANNIINSASLSPCASKHAAARVALGCLEEGVRAAEAANVEDAWVKHHAAAEAWFRGLSIAELLIEISILDADAQRLDSTVANARHRAVRGQLRAFVDAHALVERALDGEADRAGQRERLATLTCRLKHIATLAYRDHFMGNRFARRAQAVVAGMIALSLLLVWSAWACPLFSQRNDAALYGFGLVFGALGGGLSGLFDITKLRHEQSASRVWISARLIFLRPLVGAVGALIMMMSEREGLTNIIGASEGDPVAKFWVLAFVSGFSERIFLSFAGRFGSEAGGNGDD